MQVTNDLQNQYYYQKVNNSTPVTDTSAQATQTSQVIGSDPAFSAVQQAVYSPTLLSGTSSRVLLEDQEQQTGSAQSTYAVNTNKGDQVWDLDAQYGSEKPPRINAKSLMDVPFLMPSADNIKALSEHSSERFKAMLEANDIPKAPEEIKFDSEGKMVLPPDYAYADELKKALEETPGLERELRDLNALTSHYVEIQKRMPMIEAVNEANSQAEVDAILAQYQHLLTDNGNYSSIALKFAEDGTLSLSADGQPVSVG